MLARVVSGTDNIFAAAEVAGCMEAARETMRKVGLWMVWRSLGQPVQSNGP